MERPDTGGFSLQLESEEAAEEAGLRYVHDDEPGILRKKAGKSFRYEWSDGRKVSDEKILERIRSLVLPPAWSDVWICRFSNGHLQATGRDARGRKQYRYHKKWREVRDQTKYERTIAFAHALPKLRERVERDLRQHRLSKSRVLAAVTRLLERSLIRIGNEEYERENRSVGLTTMGSRHAKLTNEKIRFHFRAKGGKEHRVTLRSKRLVRVVRRCQELPGQRLFQFVGEEGEAHPIFSEDVNSYIREASGGDFSAKDFRTWAGTFLTAVKLFEFGKAKTKTEAKKNILEAVKAAASELGNTPAVCRKGYVHPAVIECYLSGDFGKIWRSVEAEKRASSLRGLSREEFVVVQMLERCSSGTEERQKSEGKM